MKKQFLILMLSLIASISASAYDFYTDNEGSRIYYDINTDGITVSVTYNSDRYDSDNSYSSDVVIPESVTHSGMTYSVTEIGSYAFRASTSLTSVTIPSSVLTIKGSAFDGCTALTSVTIGSGVTSIGAGAFEDCSSLASVTIPSSVTSIGVDAFVGTALYNNEFNWVNNALYIGNYLIKAKTTIAGYYPIKDGTWGIADKAFYGCSDLVNVGFPSSLIAIGERAFEGCTALTSATISNSVTTIGSYCFAKCSNLTSLTIPNSVTSIGASIVCETALFNQESNWQNNALYIGNHLIATKPYIVGDFAIKEGTLTIAEDAAYLYQSRITSVTIPNSVVTIGANAFSDCSSMTSVTIPESVVTIGNAAFSGCSSLASVIIPNSVTSIGKGAFGGCSSLLSIAIPESVTSISYGAFGGCSSLTSVIIPNSITSIGGAAFRACTALPSIIFPESVIALGEYAVSDCTSLSWVGLDSSLISIGDYAFENSISLTSITIPESLIAIGRTPFRWCPNLAAIYGKFASADNRCLIKDGALNSFAPGGITSYEIPSDVTSIESAAFYECTNLVSIVIGESVSYIGRSAFNGCSSLASVTIPASVAFIDNIAFSECSSLASVTVKNHDPANIKLGSTIFEYDPVSTCVLNVPKDTRDLYAVAPQWRDFGRIEEFEEGSISEVLVHDAQPENGYYDLMGRSVTNPAQGIYIRGDKKVLVK